MKEPMNAIRAVTLSSTSHVSPDSHPPDPRDTTRPTTTGTTETATHAHGTNAHAPTGSPRKNQEPADTNDPDEMVGLVRRRPLRPGASCWSDDRPKSQDASFILERCLCPRLSLAPTSGYGACNCRAPDSEIVLRISGLRDPKTALPEFVPVPHVAQSQHLPSTHRTQLRDAQAGRLRLWAPSPAHLAGGNPITFPSPSSTNSCIASTACQCAASWMNLADECVEMPNDRATRSSPLPQRPRRAPVVGHRCRVGMGEAPPSHRHARDLAIGRA